MHSVTIAMFQSSDWIKIQSYHWIANIDSEFLCDWVNVDVTGSINAGFILTGTINFLCAFISINAQYTVATKK
jgi:hypothetical protein